MALSTEVVELMMLRLQDYSNQISAVGEGSIEADGPGRHTLLTHLVRIHA